MEIIWLDIGDIIGNIAALDILWLGVGVLTLMVGLMLGIAKGDTSFHKGLTQIGNVLLLGVFVRKSQDVMRVWLVLLGLILLFSRLLLIVLSLLNDLL